MLNRIGLICLVVLSFLGCKKNSDSGPSKKGTRDELSKDSIFLYAQQTYLWNDMLPSYKSFRPRQYGSFQDEIDAIKGYQPLDKYSFMDEGAVSGEIEGGVSGDYGFFIGYSLGNPLDLRVSYVYSGSPAGQAGLVRGDQITEVNGRSDLDGRKDDVIDDLNSALFGSSSTINLKVKKANGSVEIVSLSRNQYNINPILFSRVFTVGAKKVGYFVFNSFIALPQKGEPNTPLKTRLDSLFSAFENQGVSELIVDLRYNGGGSVFTAGELANRMVPAAKSNTVMHVDYFNKTMQNGQATILKNQKFIYQGNAYSYFDIPYSPAENTEKFEKNGSLNLSRVYFIVTGSTASASELLVNSLKPVMDVKLIGRTTYGKPVGFFGIHIDKYDLYVPQFQTKNQNGEGDYFNGMTPDKQDYDDISKPFGDPSEHYLAYALNHSLNGSFTLPASISSSKGTVASISAERERSINIHLEKGKFKGMLKQLK